MNQCFIDCVEVLRPSESITVISSLLVYLTTLFLDRLSPLSSQPVSVHIFVRNWQLPFSNQRKGANDRRQYFMINLHERMLPDPPGSVPRPPDYQLDAHPTEPPGPALKESICLISVKSGYDERKTKVNSTPPHPPTHTHIGYLAGT